MEQKRHIDKYYTIALILIVAPLILSLFYLYSTAPSIGITGAPAAQPNNLSIVVNTFISCTWGNESINVKFGATDPGKNGINATMNAGDNVSPAGEENGTYYNVTNDNLSNVNINVSMYGGGLISGTNRIGVPNITFRSNTTVGSNWSNDETNGTGGTNATGVHRLNETIRTIGTDTSPDPYDDNTAVVDGVGFGMDPGQTAFYKFWITVPDSQIAGTYTGNYTQDCIAAS